MTYLLMGESNLVNKSINDIKVNNNINNNSISKYDLEVNSINEVIMDINTYNLFDDRKLVIVYNVSFIDDQDSLIKYLNNQNDNILVLVSYVKLDERKKFLKEIRKNSKVLEYFDIDLTSYVKESFKDYNISINNIMLLIDFCSNDYGRICNEIEKLKMYKYEEKEITIDDIKKLVKVSLDKNVFDLIKAINEKDVNNIFNIYYDLINNNEDEIKIISILAKNYRTLLQVKHLITDHSDNEIISMYKMHPYRLKMLKQESFNYSILDIERLILSLEELDLSIKSGKLDKRVAMEIFLSRLCS